ncbi:uncharacterized protein LOC110811577 [Carica papaya]|uniref:uncharacterized protein LOC110811577 n=1 Tax=Carica papaya TaxID=3649 RepID=UPI000B8C85A3|nr:uncharacterized protein LOC110811577 [Carica papaya]
MAGGTDSETFSTINLKGRNVGAEMFIDNCITGESDFKDYCCINIYINNNIQGVNNSILEGSEVRMKDPGVSLYFGDLKVNPEGETGIRLRLSSCGFILMIIISILALLSLSSWFKFGGISDRGTCHAALKEGTRHVLRREQCHLMGFHLNSWYLGLALCAAPHKVSRVFPLTA